MAALTIAPTADQPTITSGGLGASVLKSALMGGASVGYAREKRTGVAETAPGVAQSSTAALDLTGSTRYRYPGMHADFVAGTASNPGQYMSTNYKPNGSSQNARYLFAVEFVTSSPQVSIRFNAVAANPRLGRIYVNGLPISTNHPAQTVTASAGAGTEVLFTFPSAAVRTIKIIGFNQDEGRFGGVDVATGYTVAKPTAPVGDVLMFLGDSYMGGAGGNASAGANVVETWVWQFADAIGISNVFPDGIGGTGYITDTGGVDNSFDTRAADIAKSGATILVVGGGRNDSTGTGVQAILEGIIDAANTAGVNPVYVTNSTADSQTAVQAAVAAAVASRSKTYIGGFSIDALPKIADGIHLTQAGHASFATASYAALALTASPTGIGSSESFGVPFASQTSPTVTASPAGISTAESFGLAAATLLLAVSAVGIGSTETFGSPTASIAAGTTTASPAGIPSGEAWGSSAIATALTASPSGIGSAGAFGTPAASTALTVSPSGVSSGGVFGLPAVSSTLTASPSSIPSGEGWGAPTALAQNGVAPVGIASVESFGVPTATGTIPVAPTGIASAAAVGSPAVSTSLAVTAAGIASAEALGAPTATVASGAVTASPAGLLSAAAFGSPTITGGDQGRDITVTIGAPYRNALSFGSPTGSPIRIRSPWR